MTKAVHPFPARMAPDFALATLRDLDLGSTVLDPMAGSGTVLRQAADLGHRPIGFDMDPLAVLMARVWTTPVSDSAVERLAKRTLERAAELSDNEIALPWIDEDKETGAFIDYWFGPKQKTALRALAFALKELDNEELASDEAAASDVLRINLSRIIVTKEMCASLARDTSHSRPHRVAKQSEYDVFQGFERSLTTLRTRLRSAPPKKAVEISLGDARNLKGIEAASVDAVLTSPPYLNAIDYLRGHRLSLVWLGHRISSLRSIRSTSIGAERSPDAKHVEGKFQSIKTALGQTQALPQRYQNMIDRYAEDLATMLLELGRVTKLGARATFVVGNSCLKGTFIQNSEGVKAAAQAAGFEFVSETERTLPHRLRYLPLSEGSLSKRMSTEAILVFARTEKLHEAESGSQIHNP